jgi:hypothetical protein
MKSNVDNCIGCLGGTSVLAICNDLTGRLVPPAPLKVNTNFPACPAGIRLALAGLAMMGVV